MNDPQRTDPSTSDAIATGSVRIAIDRVVLHGFAGVDGAGLRAALRRELQRLVLAPDGNTAGGVDAPRAAATSEGSPSGNVRLARQIARAIHDRIRRP